MDSKGHDVGGPRFGMTTSDTRALGVDDLRIGEIWRYYCRSQASEIARDLGIEPRRASYEDVRQAWIHHAMEQLTLTNDTAMIVTDLKKTLDTRSALSPGSIYGLRCTAAQQSFWSASMRDYRNGPPSGQTTLMETTSMVSTHLWLKAVAHFLPTAQISASSDSIGQEKVHHLPDSCCLVFHDHPLPLDVAVDGMDSVLAWLFMCDDDGLLDVTQVLMVSPDRRECLVVNGSIGSAALSPWTQRIIPSLTRKHWRSSPKLDLPGRPTEMAWRRALERQRIQEAATGSLDGVRVVSDSAD